MCEPLLPLDELRRLKFSIASLVHVIPLEHGSYEKEAARLMAEGIERRLDWVIRTLESAKEGQRNMGV